MRINKFFHLIFVSTLFAISTSQAAIIAEGATNFYNWATGSSPASSSSSSPESSSSSSPANSSSSTPVSTSAPSAPTPSSSQINAQKEPKKIKTDPFALHTIIKNDDLSIEQKLEQIKKSANQKTIDTQDDEGYTPLHLLCDHSKYIPIIEYLITNRANINAQNFQGDTPLITALRCNKPKIAHILIDAGANIKILDRKGLSALHWACTDKNLEILRILIEKYDTCDLNLLNNLLIITKSAQDDGATETKATLTFLQPLQQRAFLAEKKKRLFTNLHKLIQLDEEVAKTQRKVIGLSSQQNESGIQNKIKEAKENVRLPTEQIENITQQIITFFNENPQFISADQDGETPYNILKKAKLKTEVAQKAVDSIIQKIQEQSDQNLINVIKALTPLDPKDQLEKKAQIKHLKNIQKICISNKTAVNAQDEHGNTALHHAMTRTNNKKYTELLYKHGANPDIKNVDGATAKDLEFAKIAFQKEQKKTSTVNLDSKGKEEEKENKKEVVEIPQVDSIASSESGPSHSESVPENLVVSDPALSALSTPNDLKDKREHELLEQQRKLEEERLLREAEEEQKEELRRKEEKRQKEFEKEEELEQEEKEWDLERKKLKEKRKEENLKATEYEKELEETSKPSESSSSSSDPVPSALSIPSDSKDKEEAPSAKPKTKHTIFNNAFADQLNFALSGQKPTSNASSSSSASTPVAEDLTQSLILTPAKPTPIDISLQKSKALLKNARQRHQKTKKDLQDIDIKKSKTKEKEEELSSIISSATQATIENKDEREQKHKADLAKRKAAQLNLKKDFDTFPRNSISAKPANSTTSSEPNSTKIKKCSTSLTDTTPEERAEELEPQLAELKKESAERASTPQEKQEDVEQLERARTELEDEISQLPASVKEKKQALLQTLRTEVIQNIQATQSSFEQTQAELQAKKEREKHERLERKKREKERLAQEEAEKNQPQQKTEDEVPLAPQSPKMQDQEDLITDEHANTDELESDAQVTTPEKEIKAIKKEIDQAVKECVEAKKEYENKKQAYQNELEEYKEAKEKARTEAGIALEKWTKACETVSALLESERYKQVRAASLKKKIDKILQKHQLYLENFEKEKHEFEEKLKVLQAEQYRSDVKKMSILSIVGITAILGISYKVKQCYDLYQTLKAKELETSTGARDQDLMLIAAKECLLPEKVVQWLEQKESSEQDAEKATESKESEK